MKKKSRDYRVQRRAKAQVKKTNENRIGLGYPIYITPPREMNITYEQFNKLSYMGLASLLISWPCVIYKNNEDSQYELYGAETPIWELRNNKRFKGKKYAAWSYSSAEMSRIDIPFGDVLEPELIRYFSYLIMK